MKVKRSASNPLNGENPSITELIDYEQFCGLKVTEKQESLDVKEIDVHALRSLKDNEESFQLIDVREPYEYAIANIAGELMPLNSIEDFAARIDRTKKVVVHCRSGVRSAKAIKKLEDGFGFDNLYNLTGGIRAWAKEIDEEVALY